ncbi:MAG: SDR family NAD(P)-dependent oxidoreductase [Candidatus Omnitrophota bacterium]
MALKGKTALVTGAAKRVGRETALRLAREGVNIFLHYNTSKTDAEKTASEIKALGVRCSLFQAELADPVEVLRMTADILKAGGVDILVNNASSFYKTPLEEIKESDWDHFMDVNLKAPFLLSKELGLAMAKKTGGQIINIADWSGFRPYKNYLPYCTSKGGLLTMTKALARDLAPKVRANAIAPGPVMLPADISPEEKEQAIKKTLLRREGSPQDVAHAVVFLAENDYVNGIVLPVDGGRSIN